MTFAKTNTPRYAKGFPTVWDSFFNQFDPAFHPAAPTSKVPANVVETDDAFHLELNAPGRCKELFTLQAEDGILTISYPEPTTQEGKTEPKYIRQEFGIPGFKKSFTLTEQVDAEKIEAKYVDGLLKILLPKRTELKPQPQQISVL